MTNFEQLYEQMDIESLEAEIRRLLMVKYYAKDEQVQKNIELKTLIAIVILEKKVSNIKN